MKSYQLSWENNKLFGQWFHLIKFHQFSWNELSWKQLNFLLSLLKPMYSPKIFLTPLNSSNLFLNLMTFRWIITSFHLLFWILKSTAEIFGAIWFAHFATNYSRFTFIDVIQNGSVRLENGWLFENVETGWRPLEGLPAHRSLENNEKRVVQPKAEENFAEVGRFCMSYKSPIQPLPACSNLPLRIPQIGPPCIRP